MSVATWDYNKFYIPAEYDVFVYFTPFENSDVSPWNVEGGSQEGAFRIRARHVTGLWGWESWDTAVRVYYRSYALPAIPASCADGGEDDEAEGAEEGEGEEGAGGDPSIGDGSEVLSCVCPAQDCAQTAEDPDTECEIPECCLPPPESETSSTDDVARSEESSTESTDGTDPDTVSDTDSSSSDVSESEPPVVAWDEVDDLVISNDDFDDVPDQVKEEIEAAAASREKVTNSDGEEFYTGRY